jgi:cleavage and polyadenylation specificity factor subunit 3
VSWLELYTDLFETDQGEQQLTPVVTANPHPHSHSHSHSHAHSHPSDPPTKDPPLSAEHERIQLFLEAHFGALSRPTKVEPTMTAEEDDADLYGAVEEDKDEDEDLLTLIVELDGAKARVDLISMVRLSLWACTNYGKER